MHKILAINDNRDNLATISALLTDLLPGCTIITALSAAEGVAKAKIRKPDAILLDADMLDADGFETCRMLTSDKETQNIPVLMITGNPTDGQIRARGLDAGAYACLSMPVVERELGVHIQAAVRRKDSADALRQEKQALERITNLLALKLGERERTFGDLFASMTEGVCIHELIHDDRGMPVDYRIIDLNPAYTQHTGIEVEEAIGRTATDLYKTKTPPYFDMYVKVVESGKPARFQTYFEPMDRHFDVTAFFLGKNRFATLFQNITERKRTEEAMEIRQRAIESAISAIGLTDLDGVITYVNPAFVATWGYEDASEIIGRNNSEFVMEKEEHEQIMMAVLTKGVWIGEVEGKKKSGEIFSLQITSSLVKDRTGIPLCIMASFNDITERKRTEAEKESLQAQLTQAQKLETVGVLAGGIAHEFNNILGSIIGYTELAGEEPDEAVRKELLDQTLIAADRAKNLVKQILTFTRHEGGERKTIDLRLLIKEDLRLLRSTAPATINIRLHITDRPCLVDADASQIQQVLMNLCTNAVHAVGEKGGVLDVSLSHEEIDQVGLANFPDLSEGTYVRLEVTDNGRGINQGIIGRIFDPFFTTKQVDEGTGLGLSVVYGIVKNHGGTITVSSKPGEGSSFIVYLPSVEHVTYHADRNPDMVSAKSRGQENILFVDDEKGLALLGERILFSLGYGVTSFTDSKEALDAFLANPGQFDLVVTDMTMPHMTGKDLASEILKIRPDMPVIVCTGHSHYLDEDEAARLGIKTVLMKPLKKKDLAAAVRRVLDETA